MRIRASLAAVFAITGFLTLVAADGTEGVKRGAESRRTELVGLIRERQGEVDKLGVDLVALRADVLAARHRISAQSASDARRVRSTQLRAGTVAMAGPGIEVTLSDSKRQTREATDRAALSVHDVDVQLVANALWAAGAEAVAVNGHRLVATSPIRGAGETITVNFRPLVPPYRVTAIGADKGHFERSTVARRFKHWVDDYGLGFTVKRHGRVEVPAYLGTLQLNSAQADDPVRGYG